MAIEGGCYCGAVRYRASGAMTNTMICHCRSCRRVAAAPVVPWVTHHSWLGDDVRWVKFGDGLPSFAESRPRQA